MTNEFRVWCKNKNEWEQDVLALLSTGDLWDVNRNAIVRKDTHIVEFYTGVEAIGDGVSLKLFQGDLIKMELADADIVFEVKFIEGANMLCSDKMVDEIPIHEYCNYENGYFICGEIVGNIHEGDK